ncbi:cyclase family protein [Geobacter sp. DSM 9736]|uniref:cyclase family protein n=1 Tax=Geobacter sp. DSM 9736 TaxID=1277350 RepID=UPI000B50493B|nr:cyclase family protein [Geobacter sp. DSM 9736]SNB47006.1 Kynurenine formamidase [Geobacter sp. DSM 9736]
MTDVILLSWPIRPGMPAYPGTPPVVINNERSMANGDSCNTSIVTLSSHSGTHIDFPRHFDPRGNTLSDYSAVDFIFRSPLLVDCHKGPGEGITADDLAELRKHPETDLLLIRTCFQRFRDTAPEVYCSNGPWLTPGAAGWLRQEFCSLRALGIDCISVASPFKREEGRRTHRTLLATSVKMPLLIIEDMCLPCECRKLKSVIVAPLLISGADGAPCTAFGVTGD